MRPNHTEFSEITEYKFDEILEKGFNENGEPVYKTSFIGYSGDDKYWWVRREDFSNSEAVDKFEEELREKEERRKEKEEKVKELKKAREEEKEKKEDPDFTLQCKKKKYPKTKQKQKEQQNDLCVLRFVLKNAKNLIEMLDVMEDLFNEVTFDCSDSGIQVNIYYIPNRL